MCRGTKTRVETDEQRDRKKADDGVTFYKGRQRERFVSLFCFFFIIVKTISVFTKHMSDEMRYSVYVCKI